MLSNFHTNVEKLQTQVETRLVLQLVKSTQVEVVMKTLIYAGIALTTALVWQAFIASIGASTLFSFVTAWLVGYGAVMALQATPKLAPIKTKQHKRAEARTNIKTKTKLTGLDALILTPTGRLKRRQVRGDIVKRPISNAPRRPIRVAETSKRTK